jgi:hypothetical protein
MFAIAAAVAVGIAAAFALVVMARVGDSAPPGRAEAPSGDGGGGGAGEALAGGAADLAAATLRFGAAVAGSITLGLVAALVALSVAAAVGIAVANFEGGADSALDSAFTKNWPQFYRGTVLAVADPLVEVANVALPFANSLNGAVHILRSNAIHIALECEAVEWGSVAREVRLAFTTLLGSTALWALQLAAEDFDLYTPLRHAQGALEGALPAVDCWCEVLSPIRTVLSDALVSGQLAATVDRALNLNIDVVADVVSSVVQLASGFGQAALSDDGFFAALGEYYWEPNRAPSLERTVRALGELVARLCDWLDDVVVAFAKAFGSLDPADVPRLFGVLGNYLQSVALDVNALADAVLKPVRYLALLGTRYDDELWNKSSPVGWRVEDLFGEAFEKAYNGSDLLETFFVVCAAPLRRLNDSALSLKADAILNDTGCMTRETLDVFTALLEIAVRLVVATFHERLVGGEYAQYLREPPFANGTEEALGSALRFGSCLADALDEIDPALGALLNETFHVFQAAVEPFVQLQRQWPDRENFFRNGSFAALVDDAFVESNAWAVAAGNVLRDFSWVGADPADDCRLRDVHFEQFPADTSPSLDQWRAFYPWYVDPFCCLGGALEELLRLAIGLVRGIVEGTVSFATAETFKEGFLDAFRDGGPLDMRKELLPMVDFLLRDVFRFSCVKFGVARAIVEAWFPGASVPTCANPPDNLAFWELAVEAGTGFVRTPLDVVIGGAAEIVSWIVSAVDGTSCSQTGGTGAGIASCWCVRLKAFYVATGGLYFDWIAQVARLVVCIFNAVGPDLPNVTKFVNSMAGALGAEGSLATGNFFCAILDFFSTIWDLIACWSSADGTFFGCVWDLLKTFLEDLVNAIVDCFKGLWSELKEIISCIPKKLWQWFSDFINDFRCLWQKDNPCPKLLDYMGECSFVIPSACSEGGLRLTTGEVKFTFPQDETETAIFTADGCEIYDVFSDEWLACKGESRTTYTETGERTVLFADVVRSAQRVSELEGNFGGSLGINNKFGFALAFLGDMDGDGVSEIAVGNPGDDTGNNDAGAVWILFMNADGTTKGDEVKIANGAGGLPAGSLAISDMFGTSVANAGDLDEDGVEDLVVGMRGAIWIILLNLNGTAHSTFEISDGLRGFPSGVLDLSDQFGWSVAGIGDLDFDGNLDIAVGAPFDPIVTAKGAVWILFLNSSDWVKSAVKIDEDSLYIAIEADAYFGYALSDAGDVDGDGIRDLMVGAPGARSVMLVFMLRDGTAKDVVKIGADTPQLIAAGIETGDYFGQAVAATGDLDGDGVGDFAVGAPVDDDGAVDSGSVFLLLMTASNGVRAVLKISATAGHFPGAILEDERFGTALSVTDLDGDGVRDLAIGVPHFSSGRGGFWTAFLGGELARVRRSTSMVVGERKVSDDSGNFAGILYDEAYFGGASCPLGDLNGDGTPDVLVSSYNQGLGGVLWTLFMKGDGAVKSFVKINEAGGGSVPLVSGEAFGLSLATLGDVDGDGVTDVAAGSPYEDVFHFKAGAAWILFMKADGSVKSAQKISHEEGGFAPASWCDTFGFSLAGTGDVDGDGVPDLAVGAPSSASCPNGTVWILNLAANGTVKSFASVDAETPGMSGVGPYDAFGASMASLGDLDGDGFGELAIGATDYLLGDPGGRTGAVHVVFLGANSTVSSHVRISQGESGFPTTSVKITNFGFSLGCAGSLDSDHVPDLLIGETKSADRGPYTGAVWVLLLRTDGTVRESTKIGYYGEGFLGDIHSGDAFGFSVASAGDVNGDGAVDIAVGAGLDDGDGANRGAVWFLTLRPAALAGKAVSEFGEISEGAGGFSGDLDSGDQFGGACVSVGDLDDDGVQDVAVGAPGDDDGGANAGAVWILFMNANGTARDQQKISATAGGFSGSLAAGDLFGWSLEALGDLDGDGAPDLAVGAVGDLEGGLSTGAVWILFLNRNGTVASHQKIGATSGNFSGVITSTRFGFALACPGDADGDGVADLVVGAPFDSDGGTFRGAIWVLFLASNGTVSGHQKISDTAGNFSGGLSDACLFGSALTSVGDMDANGVVDVAVGAPVFSDKGFQRGALWILFLASGSTVESHRRISAAEGHFLGPIEDGALFGRALASLPDLDGDGVRELAVGAPGDDDGGSDRGAVWLPFLAVEGYVKEQRKISHSKGAFSGVLDDFALFGSGLANLGDPDADGLESLAVGASGSNTLWILELSAYVAPSTKRSLSGIERTPEGYAIAAGLAYPAPAPAPRVPAWRVPFVETAPPEELEVISFGDVERWCAYEGTMMGELSEHAELNENSTQIPPDQKRINRVLLNATGFLVTASYRACLASATAARLLDVGLGFPSKNQTLVDPKTFYDPFRFLLFARSAWVGASAALDYHLRRATVDPRRLTAYQFQQYLELSMNVTDPLTTAIGLYFDRMIRAARVLLVQERGNLAGSFLEAAGDTFYEQVEPRPPARKRREAPYSSAPLHLGGYDTPAWTEFWRSKSAFARGALAAWRRGAGFYDRTWTLRYITAAARAPAERYAWAQAGRDPATAPRPRLRLGERERLGALLAEAAAPSRPGETPELATARRSAATVRVLSEYPAVSLEDPDERTDFLDSRVVCPSGTSPGDANCSARACRAPDGAANGACGHVSDLLGRAICACEASAAWGACCADGGGGCANASSASACASGSAFVAGAACSGATCSAASGACCAQNGTCALRALESQCPSESGTFLPGSACAACSDPALVSGACCEGGACSLTIETACAGAWNGGQNCSSPALSSECESCERSLCLACQILNVLPDVMDFVAANMEWMNASVVSGACCYGASPSNRSCAVTTASDCGALEASQWFWGEKCTFCQAWMGAPALALVGAAEARRAAASGPGNDALDRGFVGAVEWTANQALRLLGRVVPAVAGGSVDSPSLFSRVERFFTTSDPDDAESWLFWAYFFFTCDVFDNLLPGVGREGLGLVPGFWWALITLTVLFAVLTRCCKFAAGLLAGSCLIMLLFLLTLGLAYFYSPACFAPAILPRHVLTSVTGRSRAANSPALGVAVEAAEEAPPPEAEASPLDGIGEGVPVVGGRLGKIGSRLAAGIAKVKTAVVAVGRKLVTAGLAVPKLPLQLPNDFRNDVLGALDVDCLERCAVACPRESGKWPCAWTTADDVAAGLDCLQAEDCCGVARCPASREFPECSAEPFRFTTSTRELAYWLRVWAPRANCFLLHGDFFLSSWIRDVGEVSRALDFPGEECSEPDFDSDARWRYCARRNVLLLAVWAALLLVAYVVLLAGLALAVELLRVSAKLALWGARRTARAARSAAGASGISPEAVARGAASFARARLERRRKRD